VAATQRTGLTMSSRIDHRPPVCVVAALRGADQLSAELRFTLSSAAGTLVAPRRFKPDGTPSRAQGRGIRAGKIKARGPGADGTAVFPSIQYGIPAAAHAPHPIVIFAYQATRCSPFHDDDRGTTGTGIGGLSPRQGTRTSVRSFRTRPGRPSPARTWSSTSSSAAFGIRATPGRAGRLLHRGKPVGEGRRARSNVPPGYG